MPSMLPELIAILVTAVIQITGLAYIAYIARIIHNEARDIHNETRLHVLQGRRMEDLLRELSQPLR